MKTKPELETVSGQKGNQDLISLLHSLKSKEMPAASSSSPTIAEHIRLRRPRNDMSQGIAFEADPGRPNPPQTQGQSSRSKSTISSLFQSTNTTPRKKLNNFRGFGCSAAASQQVSLPAVIRTSADWDGKKVKKKKQKSHDKSSSSSSSHNNNNINSNVMKISSYSSGNRSAAAVADAGNNNNNSNSSPGGCVVMQDVWCGFSSDAVVGSVDCVVARRNAASGRGKIDGEKLSQRERERERDRERSSCIARRAAVNPESFPFPDSDSAFAFGRPELDVFGPRYYRHVRHPSPDGLAEIMLLQNSLMMGGRLDSHDHFRDWRLDVDNMTYEELLELGDRIGYVSTGLKEEEMGRCLRKLKNSSVNDLSKHLSIHMDKKCSICQEEYEADDELGKLDCGHSFHIQCIKEWLAHKNACPVCKAAVMA